MRILHIMPHYFPAVRYGGPIRSVQGLAAATAALGHEVHVYTTNVDGPGVSAVPTGQPVDHDGVKVWYFPNGAGRKIFRSPQLGRALDETVSSFDLVHIHYMWVWTTIRAAAAARRATVPYVLAPRGMLVADLIRRRGNLAKRTWLSLFGKKDIAEAAALHVTSEIEACDFKALDLVARRIAVIPNGVDVEVEATGESRRPRAGEKPYVLFLGRISWKKGLDRLIRAFPAVDDADLVIAGYDEDGHQAVVERLASQARIAARVRWVGPVEGDAKHELLRQARCLVLPSYNENFGMVVVEAMAARRPVVVTPEVGLADVVRDSGSGLVAEGEPAALAAAINWILRNPADAERMGAAGVRTVRDRYLWSAVARRTLQLYEECLVAAKLPPEF